MKCFLIITILFALLLWCGNSAAAAAATKKAAKPQYETRREKMKTKEEVDKLPDHVHKTIQSLHTQGMPKEAIAERIKHSAKNIAAHKIVDGVVGDGKSRSPLEEKKAQEVAQRKKKQSLKNDIRKHEKMDRQNQRRKRDEL